MDLTEAQKYDTHLARCVTKYLSPPHMDSFTFFTNVYYCVTRTGIDKVSPLCRGQQFTQQHKYNKMHQFQVHNDSPHNCPTVRRQFTKLIPFRIQFCNHFITGYVFYNFIPEKVNNNNSSPGVFLFVATNCPCM